MMVDVFIEIGNTDDKLGQKDWAMFCQDVRNVVFDFQTRIFGQYYSHTDSVWQNACFHFSIEESALEHLKENLAVIAGRYKQDSIALTTGVTRFVKP
jgi:hypothetical protein